MFLKIRKIHKKTPVSESLFNKVAALKPLDFGKKRLWKRCFLMNFAKCLRTPYFIKHLRWLLLKNNIVLPILESRGNLPNKFSPSSLAIASAPPVVGGNNCDSVCKTKLRLQMSCYCSLCQTKNT